MEINQLKVLIDECITGSVKLIKTPIKMLSAYIQLIRKEIILSENKQNEDILFEYQLVEGRPDEEETFPFRIYLKYIDDISVSMKRINNLFSICYYIRLSINDVFGTKIIPLGKDYTEITILRTN